LGHAKKGEGSRRGLSRGRYTNKNYPPKIDARGWRKSGTNGGVEGLVIEVFFSVRTQGVGGKKAHLQGKEWGLGRGRQRVGFQCLKQKKRGGPTTGTKKVGRIREKKGDEEGWL